MGSWFKKYDIRVRAIVLQKANIMLISLKDHKNNCVLDFSKHKLPPNYNNKGAAGRWMTKRINDFLSDCRNLGINVEFVTQTNAGFVQRMADRFSQRKRR